jgi:hypothetical protein
MKYLKWLWIGMLFVIPAAWAICPLCTVAVGAGIGFFEWFGLSDLIIGLWVGGLVVSLAFWTADWFHRKHWDFPLQGLVMLIIYSAIIVVPLYYPLGYIGRLGNTLWHIDRLLLGIIIGGIVFFFGSILHMYLKIRHEGRVYFPLQKVIVPILPLLLLSFIFYWV